jgi:hypothetical protein
MQCQHRKVVSLLDGFLRSLDGVDKALGFMDSNLLRRMDGHIAAEYRHFETIYALLASEGH